MTQLYDLPIFPLQFYKTVPYPCSYLAGKTARSHVALPINGLPPVDYSALIQRGFRRSGLFIYRPCCDDCQACISVRVQVGNFSPRRSQRRAWRKNQSLQVVFVPLDFYPEHYALYQRYQEQRHQEGPISDSLREQYEQFLLSTPAATMLVEFRRGDELQMVSLIDLVGDGWSAVYTFFAPEKAQLGLGIFNILWQIEQCRQRGLPYLYLGYWIEQCQKMAYKQLFQPLQAWQRGSWRPFGVF